MAVMLTVEVTGVGKGNPAGEVRHLIAKSTCFLRTVGESIRVTLAERSIRNIEVP